MANTKIVQDFFPVPDDKELETWLHNQPVDWIPTIGVRCALRVLPLSWSDLDTKSGGSPEMLSACVASFRAAFVSWVQCRHPSYQLRVALVEAASDYSMLSDSNESFNSVIAATCLAADAVANVKSSFALVGNVIRAAFFAAMRSAGTGAVAQLWHEIIADASWVHRTHKNENSRYRQPKLINEPLWANDVRDNPHFHANFPLWVRQAFDALALGPMVKSGVWKPFVDWYRRILPNSLGLEPESAFGEKADAEIAKLPRDFWIRAPNDVLSDIELIIRGRQPQFVVRPKRLNEPNLEQSPQPNSPIDEVDGQVVSETRLSFRSDAPDLSIDHLDRARVAFVLAGRLNQVWDTMNPEPAIDLDTGFTESADFAAKGWRKRDINSVEISWLRKLMPATSGRLLETNHLEGAARNTRAGGISRQNA